VRLAVLNEPEAEEEVIFNQHQQLPRTRWSLEDEGIGPADTHWHDNRRKSKVASNGQSDVAFSSPLACTSPSSSQTNNPLEAFSSMLKKAGALFQRKSKRNYSLSEDPVIDSTKTESSRDPNRLQTCSLHALSQNDIFTAESEDLCYEAESPDEAALVYAARAYGFILLARTPNSVTVRLPSGEELVFEVLDTLTFDSNRKRMSVLVRHPVTKEYVLYTKGADYAIMELLGTPYAGATGIEDRLQENVPDTIVALREAGIHVWVLTGDKPETAVNIGYACRLLEEEDLVINMSCQNKVRRLQVIDR
ncbi:hypothetical protein GOODEAATRI_001203, partial [Goodea atripinnis]